MLSALIIGCTPEVNEQVSRFCGRSADICVYRALEQFPHLHEVVRMVNTYAPDVIFLQLWAEGEQEIAAARVHELVDEIWMTRPETSIIGLLPGAEQAGVRLAAELGIVELLILPYKYEDFSRTLFRALERAAGATPGAVYSFLPAKSGAGATVTALNVAQSLARDFHRRTLLIEGDFFSGPIATMLKLQPERSVLDALEESDKLTEALWDRLVTRINGLDLLLASGADTIQPVSPFSYFRLLTFAQQHYDEIIVDFPGVVDEAADPLLARSKTIYLVCTPESTCIALARRRLFHLERRGIVDSSLGVILNRCDQADSEPKVELEKVIGRKIVAELPNDYEQVRGAIESGGFVDPDSHLGKAYTRLAARLAGLEPPASTSRLKSLLRKWGAVTPAGYVHNP